MNKTSLAITSIALLCLAGCPTDSQSITELSQSQIPSGTYMGMVTSTSKLFVNAELIEETSDPGTTLTATFSETGIPLDIFSGEPERPGLSGTFDYGGFTLTEVTESVTAASTRVTVRYKDTVLYHDISDFGDITMTGYSTTVYTLLANGSIEYTSTMQVASEFFEGVGHLSLRIEGSGTLHP